MKTKVIITICLLAGSAAFGNHIIPHKPVETEKNKTIGLTSPVFTGTKLAGEEVSGKSPFLIYSYLRENVEYPDEALKYNVQGTEVIQFTVTTTGEVTKIKVINSVYPEIDEEVMKVLSTTNGMWEPGLHNGKPVEMKREISMVFQIRGVQNGTDSKLFKEQATSLFNKGSKALISQNNPTKALKYFDKALKYLPYESTILNSRAMAKLILDDEDGAREDWNRMNLLLAAKIESENNLQLITENIGNIKANQEVQNIISKDPH